MLIIGCRLFVVSKVFYKKLLVFVNKMPYYAVARGKTTGIFTTWADCEKQIVGISYANYKKFSSQEEAEEWLAIFKCVKPTKRAEASLFSTVKIPVCPIQVENKLESASPDIAIARLEGRINCIETMILPLQNDLLQIKKELQEIKSRSISTFSTLKRPLSDDSTDHWSDDIKHFKSDSDVCVVELPAERGDAPDTNEFKIDKDGYVQVYTDGSCENNGKKGARAGYGVYFGENHKLNTSKPVSGRATNNCGEIQAATCAIHLAASAGVAKLCINTDSQFMINSMTKWIDGWKKRGWKLADGGPVKNKVDFMELDAATKLLSVKWQYVKAHCGILGNERADALAKQGSEMHRNKLLH